MENLDGRKIRCVIVLFGERTGAQRSAARHERLHLFSPPAHCCCCCCWPHVRHLDDRELRETFVRRSGLPMEIRVAVFVEVLPGTCWVG